MAGGDEREGPGARGGSGGGESVLLAEELSPIDLLSLRYLSAEAEPRFVVADSRRRPPPTFCGFPPSASSSWNSARSSVASASGEINITFVTCVCSCLLEQCVRTHARTHIYPNVHV